MSRTRKGSERARRCPSVPRTRVTIAISAPHFWGSTRIRSCFCRKRCVGNPGGCASGRVANRNEPHVYRSCRVSPCRPKLPPRPVVFRGGQQEWQDGGAQRAARANGQSPPAAAGVPRLPSGEFPRVSWELPWSVPWSAGPDGRISHSAFPPFPTVRRSRRVWFHSSSWHCDFVFAVP